MRIVEGAEEGRNTLLKRAPHKAPDLPVAVRETIRRVFDAELGAEEVVDRILRDVRTDGDAAIRRYNQALDGVSAPDVPLKVSEDEIKAVKSEINRKKIELMVTIAGTNLVSRQDGPFTLYDRRTCKIELEVAIPRDVIKSKHVEEVDRFLARVAQRFSTRDEALDSSDWNGREADEYPEDYERTLAHHAVWSAEEINRGIDEQLDRSLLTANELAREVDGNLIYLSGFAEGARMVRAVGEHDCGRLIGSTAGTFRLNAPEEFTDNTTWCADFFDGQALVYSLAVLSRLPACYVDVPELPAEYADTSLAQR